MSNPNDPFDALFNNAMQITAQDPVPVPGSPFYPMFTQAGQGKIPKIQAETVYDDMPKLTPFVPGTPFGADIAAYTPLVLVPPKTRLPGSPAVRTYASRYYAFAWWEHDMSGDELTVYANSAKNLFQFKNSPSAYGPNAKDAFSYPIEIAPPVYAMKGTGITDDCRTQRIILIHTLLDLDRILQKTCRMHVLSDNMVARLTAERDAYTP